jgi:hypothetical protein
MCRSEFNYLLHVHLPICTRISGSEVMPRQKPVAVSAPEKGGGSSEHT